MSVIDHGLITAVLPLADAARRDVARALARSPLAPETTPEREALGAALEESLIERLHRATAAVLVLELGVAAERGLLVGDTPQARYAFFQESLADRAFADALIGQYPALARRVMVLVENWRAASLELLARLESDLPAIHARLLDGAAPGPLIDIEALGDSHARGRCVSRLTFASGEPLIYKPRPVAMEAGVFALVEWANDRGLSPDLMAAAALDRHGYGWVRNIAAAACDDIDGVHRFYRRQGANLALTYLLGATDLHFENVLAAGEYPVIVDWETLFQATPEHASSGATGAALDVLNQSVARTLLLPVRIFGDLVDGEPRSADLSALGYADDQEAPYPAAQWENAGTDAMRLTQVYGAMPPGDCLPQFEGRRVPAAAYLRDIETGLAIAYGFFLRHRRALRKGPLAAFKGRTVRNVFRPTAPYAQLLTHSWRPGLGADMRGLRAALRRRLLVLDEESPAPRAILAAEIADLVAGDVPYFESGVGKRRATSPTAPSLRARLPDRGWRAARRRVKAMDSADLERQIWLTRVAFADLTSEPPPTAARLERFSRRQAMAMASGLGDRLCDLAIVKGERASWLFPQVEDDARLVPAAVGYDLYSGLSGIALFLGRLSLVTGDERHRTMAIAAVSEALGAQRAKPVDAPVVGAFDGVGGLAYAMALLGVWLSVPAWTFAARELVRNHAAAAPDAAATDLISGRAGFLAAGVAVSAITGDATLVEALRPLARALQGLRGASLPRAADAGLAHGKAGVGFALARWGLAAGDNAAGRRGAALIADDLAISQGARARGPVAPNDGRAMLAWCRGGAGAALAARRLGQGAGPAVIALMHDLAAKGPRQPLCLCHGLAGLLELRDTPALRAQFLSRIAAGETSSDHAHRLETPGLMLGLAGTGYTLLRLTTPTPSILTLETS